MSKIKAGTTTTTAYSVEADTTGTLVLQTGASPTTAVTVGTDQSVTFAQAANLPNTFGFKNRIINGGMVIDQRNAGASVTVTTTTGYTLDRYRFEVSQSSKLSCQQNGGGVTPPAGFSSYMGITSLSAYSIGANDYFALEQFVEGYNIADLAWGTASAASVTLSFWVRSSLTGTFGGSVMNSSQNRAYPFTYTINLTNTWEQKSITIPGSTSGTWLTDNGRGIFLIFGLGIGSTFSGTANTWANTNYYSATGATSVVGTSGATFYITGVQLEKGSTATSFDFRSTGTELALCQRYYWRWTANYSSHPITVFQAYNSTSAWGKLFDLPVSMRAVPTASTSGNFGATNAAASAINNFSTTGIAQNTANMLATGAWTGSISLVAGNATVVVAAAAGNYIDASAEL